MSHKSTSLLRPSLEGVAIALAACVVLSATPVVATPYGSLPTAQMILKFTSGELASTPRMLDGYISIQTHSGADSSITLPGILKLAHLSGINTATRPLERPWVVALLGSECEPHSIPCQLPAPHLDYLAPVPGALKFAGEPLTWGFNRDMDLLQACGITRGSSGTIVPNEVSRETGEFQSI